MMVLRSHGPLHVTIPHRLIHAFLHLHVTDHPPNETRHTIITTTTTTTHLTLLSVQCQWRNRDIEEEERRVGGASTLLSDLAPSAPQHTHIRSAAVSGSGDQSGRLQPHSRFTKVSPPTSPLSAPVLLLPTKSVSSMRPPSPLLLLLTGGPDSPLALPLLLPIEENDVGIKDGS
jgi:hypothetical protein